MERSHWRAARFNPRQEKVRFVAYTRLLGRTFRGCHEADPPPISVRTRQPLSLSLSFSLLPAILVTYWFRGDSRQITIVISGDILFARER